MTLFVIAHLQPLNYSNYDHPTKIVALRWGRLGGWGAERENKKGCTVFWYTPHEAKDSVKPCLTDGATAEVA